MEVDDAVVVAQHLFEVRVRLRAFCIDGDTALPARLRAEDKAT
jgi:hypothetical protein